VKGRANDEQTERRRGAHLYGLQAESAAALLLRLKGYTILARRFAVNGGEIDLIARRGGAIAFVEVKARADLEVAAFAISATKRRRIARAARVWLTRNPWTAGLTLRGDAVLVARWRLPRHAPDAYRLEID
jgi:putative endonuclease